MIKTKLTLTAAISKVPTFIETSKEAKSEKELDLVEVVDMRTSPFANSSISWYDSVMDSNVEAPVGDVVRVPETKSTTLPKV